MREDPVKYIDKCYYKATYIETYKYALKPLNGLNMWSAVEGWPIHPPPIKKNPGRPKKLRKKDLSESSSGKGPRFSQFRSGVRMKCQNYNTYGHNRRTCKSVIPPVINNIMVCMFLVSINFNFSYSVMCYIIPYHIVSRKKEVGSHFLVKVEQHLESYLKL